MKALKTIGFWVAYIVSCILSLVLLLVLFSGLLTLFQPKGTLFISCGNGWMLAMPLLFVAIFLLLPTLWKRVFRREKAPFDEFAKFVRRHLRAAVVVMIGLLYVLLTDATYVTRSTITHRTPLHPVGVAYSYEDVVGVDTGFYSKQQGLLFGAEEGDFYYILCMEDGTRLDLSQTLIINDNRYENYDSYQEIVELDAALMEQDVPKITAPNGVEYNTLGEKSQEMLSRVVTNS